MRNRKQQIGIVVVAALVIASGCLTVSVESQVNGDGTIAKYELTMDMPNMLLQQMRQSAQENGTTLKEQVRSGYDSENYNSIDVEISEEGDRGLITITLRGFDPAEVQGSDFQVGTTEGGQGGGMPADQSQDNGPQINVTVEEDRIVYTDDSFYDPNADTGGGDDGGMGEQSFRLEYEVTMPGKVIESETNADSVDGKTATWNRSGTDVFTDTEIRAVSQKPAGGGFLGLPGFGAGIALVALIVAAGVLTVLRRRRLD